MFVGKGRVIGLVLGVSACAVSVLGLVARAVPAEENHHTERPVVSIVVADPLPPMPTEQARVFLASLAVDSTARISARTCSGFLLGSGFVADGVLFTNRHMVEGAREAKVELGGQTVFAQVLGTSDIIDLATIDATLLLGPQSPRVSDPGPDGPWLHLASTNPQIGEPLLLAGHAGGGDTEVVFSRVHTYSSGSPYGVGGEVLLIDTPTEGGFSGGPVLNREGEVVGILQGFDRATGLTLAIPVESMSSATFARGSDEVPRAESSTSGVLQGGNRGNCGGNQENGTSGGPSDAD